MPLLRIKTEIADSEKLTNKDSLWLNQNFLQ